VYTLYIRRKYCNLRKWSKSSEQRRFCGVGSRLKGNVCPTAGRDCPDGVYRYSCTLFFFNLGARWVWVVNATPRPLYPMEIDPIPILQEAGATASGPVWTGVGILPAPGIDLRTVQPIADRYTDCVIPAHDSRLTDEEMQRFVLKGKVHCRVHKGTTNCPR
jgi:hypothetical protein